jgi:two-component system KDP operon response regulator KdpE
MEVRSNQLFNYESLPSATVSGPGKNHSRKGPSSKRDGRLLIVDDDPYTGRTLHSTLHHCGFEVSEARSGEEAVALCRIVRYEAVLLDIGTPAKRAIDTCRELRRMLPRAALFMLSVNNDHAPKLEAFEAGADDYITKPFHLRELTARIRSAFRRIRACSAQSDEIVSVGDLEFDPVRRLVSKTGKPVHLTPKEFALLHYLISHAGMPVARSVLLREVWGSSEYADHLEYLRCFVRQLRKKLEDDPSNPRYLLTDSHIGYHFTDLARPTHS